MRRRGRRKRLQTQLTRPLHTEETRRGRSGGAGIAGTDPTAPSYRLTKWRRRLNTSLARSAHWLPPLREGGESSAGPCQLLPVARRPLEGWSQEKWQTTIGKDGCPSGLKAEMARGIGGGEKNWEHVSKREPVSEPPSCVELCGRSHLESGYVASQAEGSVSLPPPRLPPSCIRAGVVHLARESRVACRHLGVGQDTSGAPSFLWARGRKI